MLWKEYRLIAIEHTRRAQSQTPPKTSKKGSQRKKQEAFGGEDEPVNISEQTSGQRQSFLPAT